MPKNIVINGQPVGRGEQVVTRMAVTRLPSGTEIEVPVHVYRAEQDGPVLLLMAGMHGDEVNGVEIIRRLIKRKLLQPVKGTVIAIPILNVFGFLNFSREVPDGKDVNRSFPGSKTGSLASRVAWKFCKEILPYVDYGIDFHTGGASRTNYPQIRCVLGQPDNEMLAHAFCAPFLLNAPLRPGSLRKEAAKRGKSIIVYESGESLRFDEHGIKLAMEGTLRVMHKLGMANHSSNGTPSVICHKSSWIRARAAGLFKCTIRNGDYIHKNQQVGIIHDPYGEYEYKIKSSTSGYVIGLNHMPVVNLGDALVHIGIEK